MIRISSLIALVALFSVNVAHAVPALSVNIANPISVDYYMANGATNSTSSTSINVVLTGGCTGKVKSLMFGKALDKNTTTYPINGVCPTSGTYSVSVPASGNDVLPASAVADFKTRCTKVGTIQARYSFDSTLYADSTNKVYGTTGVIAKSTGSTVYFNVNCK